MTVMEFFGCTLIAFGPPFAMFIMTIARDPIRIIILISAAFFWLLSLLLSSLLWYIVSSLRKQLAFGVVFSVIFQEAFRFFFYKILRKAEVGLKKVEEVGVDGTAVSSNRNTLAYVAGLGFGVMSGTFSLVNVLADSVGPGTVGLKGDSPDFFLISAFTTLAYILLHTFWGVIFFNACDQKQYLLMAYVPVSHLLISCLPDGINPDKQASRCFHLGTRAGTNRQPLKIATVDVRSLNGKEVELAEELEKYGIEMTLLNQQRIYPASLTPAYFFVIVSGILAFRAAGGSMNSFISFFTYRIIE